MKLSLAMVCLVLAVPGSLVLGGKVKGPSKNLYRFMTLLSGYYTNHDELDYRVKSSHLWRPVNIGSLHDKLTFYYEVRAGDTIVNQKIWVVDEDRLGVIHVQALNLLEQDSYQPGELEHADFTHIKHEPLISRPECDIVLYSADENVFVGTIPGCVEDINGSLPVFGITFTCYSVTFHVCNADFIEHRPKLPFINFKKYSYPLLSVMTKGAYFVNRCLYTHE